MYVSITGPFRKCHLISGSARCVLQKTFARSAYPEKATFHMLSQQLGLNESRVRRWFCSQRKSVKRANHKEKLSIGENACKAMYMYA